MGRTLYAYADKLWEVSQRFVPTDEAREFTLQPGEYLFMCYGGKGGERGTNRSHNCPVSWNYGAAAYGVFTTDQEETMYAVVGGNGNDYDYPSNPNAGLGGFNGGGNGGTSSNGSDVTGAGGGGATDIRLTMDDTMITQPQRQDVPNEYVELEYIEKRWKVNGTFDTGYYMKSTSKVVVDMWLSRWSITAGETDNSDRWRIILGSRTAYQASDEFLVAVRIDTNNRAERCPLISGPHHNIYYAADQFGTQMPYNYRFKLSAQLNGITWENEDGTTSEITGVPVEADAAYPLKIFTYNSGGNSDYQFSNHGMRVYGCKIYENNVLLHEFVPVKRVSDNKLGFYDVVAEEFRPITDTLYGKEKEVRSTTLLSRILVAAGGGGNAVFSGYSNVRFTFGGGKYGSAIIGSKYSEADSGLSASQSDGYAFGKGMNGIKKTGGAYGSEGAGGGGGGWFGGYSVQYSSDYSDIPGSGGSSYALTSDSWKPYGYIPTSHYHLTHTALVPCQSSEGLILICTPVKTFMPEDKIIVPFHGASTKIKMFPGTYDVKCWGAEGKTWMGDATSRIYGGYSEGRLIFGSSHDMYAVVGGSGLFYSGSSGMVDPYRHNEFAGFNGGGTLVKVKEARQVNYEELCGGGATDLRLTMDQTPVHPTIPDPETRDDIPSAYTQLKALVSTTYFDSRYIRKANSEFFIDMQTTNNLSGYEILFGDGNNGAPQTYLFYPNPPSRSYVAHWQLGSVEANGSKKMPSQTRVKIQTTSHSLTWTSSTDSETLTIPEGTFTGPANANIYFGNGHNGTSSGSVWGDGYVAGTWYAIKISESGTMVHDFVPCKRNSDNAIGWYDVIDDVFYTWGTDSVPLSDVTFPSRSLMSRIIVAGGGGSYSGNSSYPGGVGGGTTGETKTGGNGVTGGGGTQTESPSVASHPEANGGFGYGGHGYHIGLGRAGCGGGGWYGGSGSHPNGRDADDIKAGQGGSGYVLTESSYKPADYIPDSEFYMTNAVTTAGGNTLPPNITKIEIDVIEAFCNKLVLHDAAGYKAYDEDESKWVVFSDSITPELIDEYGRFDIPNVEGMLKRFEVIMDDPDDALTGIEVSYVPLPQSIVFLVPRRYKIGRTIIDAVYDTSIYDFQTNVSKYSDEYNAYKITIDKISDSESLLKLYSIMLLSQ